jgi:leucyl aminopeptidase (aminopeptidase T)
MSENRLKLGAKKLIETCIGLAKGEELVIFCDADRIDLADAITGATLKAGAHSSTFLIQEAARPIQRLSEVMRTSLEEADAALIMLSHLHAETKFRKQIVDYTRRRPLRVANMPGVGRVHLEKWINLQYGDLAINTERVASALLKAKKVEVVTKAGTHIEIPLAGWDSGAVEAETGLLTEPGLWGNLPAGEAFVVPVLRKTYGTIVVDGSIPNLVIKQPLTIIVEKGKATNIQPEDCEEYRILSRSFADGGSNSRVLVELGIGTNDQITAVQGSTIADEKIIGTVHFGFGSSAGFGGSVEAGNHDDLVVLNPTVLLDAIPLIKEGVFSRNFVFEEEAKDTAPLNIPTARKIARKEGVRCMEISGRLHRYWKGCLGFKHMTMIGNESTSKTARRIWYNIGGFRPYSKTVHELARILEVDDEMILHTLAVMDRYGLISY